MDKSFLFFIFVVNDAMGQSHFVMMYARCKCKKVNEFLKRQNINANISDI